MYNYLWSIDSSHFTRWAWGLPGPPAPAAPPPPPARRPRGRVPDERFVEGPLDGAQVADADRWEGHDLVGGCNGEGDGHGVGEVVGGETPQVVC